MNQTASFKIWTLLVLYWLLVVQCGCGNDRASQETLRSAAPNNELVARAAFGLKDCYVGMPLTELRGEWKKVNLAGEDPERFKEYLRNRNAGLDITHDAKKIKVVFLYSRSEDHEPFSGRIEGGISASSSVEDIIHAMGQPTNISITTNSGFGENPGAQETDLLYLEKGIHFSFVNAKLSHVGIAAPIFDYDPDLWQDIGDTQDYRAIVPRKSQTTEE